MGWCWRLPTLLAVAYDTRREEAVARHLAPGHCADPSPRWLRPSERRCPRVATACCSRAWRDCGICCCAVISGPACGCDLHPVPTSARACAKRTPAAPGPIRIAGAGPASHSPHAGRLGPPHHATARQAILPLWNLTDLTRPVTVAPAVPGPATRGAGSPIRPPPTIPAQKMPL